MNINFLPITLNSIFELLTIIGFTYFIVKRFILRQPPIPSGAFKRVNRDKLMECLAVLEKHKQTPGVPYSLPDSLKQALSHNLYDSCHLKLLLCSIADHVGINGEYIRLNIQDKEAPYAGNISTNGAWTTINLQRKPYYDLDVITAVLAHEVMHLYLYYHGIHIRDTLSNEVLTDTAAVYFGFGEYLYRGYKIIETHLAFSYHKVGYIRPEDVTFIMQKMRS